WSSIGKILWTAGIQPPSNPSHRSRMLARPPVAPPCSSAKYWLEWYVRVLPPAYTGAVAKHSLVPTKVFHKLVPPPPTASPPRPLVLGATGLPISGAASRT